MCNLLYAVECLTSKNQEGNLQQCDNHIYKRKLVCVYVKNTNSLKGKWTKVIYKHIFKSNKYTAGVLNEKIFKFTIN